MTRQHKAYTLAALASLALLWLLRPRGVAAAWSGTSATATGTGGVLTVPGSNAGSSTAKTDDPAGPSSWHSTAQCPPGESLETFQGSGGPFSLCTVN